MGLKSHRNFIVAASIVLLASLSVAVWLLTSNREPRVPSYMRRPMSKLMIRVTPDPHVYDVSDEALLHATPFHFRWGDAGLHRSANVYREIDHDGKIRTALFSRYVREAQGTAGSHLCHTLVQTVDASIVAELRQLLVSAQFYRLGQSYSDGAYDTWVSAFDLDVSGTRKTVTCSGQCPKVMRPIFALIHNRLPEVPDMGAYPIAPCPATMHETP